MESEGSDSGAYLLDPAALHCLQACWQASVGKGSDVRLCKALVLVQALFSQAVFTHSTHVAVYVVYECV